MINGMWIWPVLTLSWRIFSVLFEYFEYRNKRGLKLLTSPQSGNRLANFFRDILRSRKNEGYSFHHTVEISETDPVTLRGPAKGSVVNVCFFFFFPRMERKPIQVVPQLCAWATWRTEAGFGNSMVLKTVCIAVPQRWGTEKLWHGLKHLTPAAGDLC